MGADLLIQIIGVVGPLITQIIQDHFNKNGEFPTPEQIQQAFQSHYDEYMAEGAAWRAQHPRT